ncbi:Hypothetical predicted protein [Mytilus galloprovincialis]|nr:Hypothetical predicted protein [Mytilus galloprovincialis]
MLTSSDKERLVYKHMVSSSKKEEYNYKYWFYQLNMTCDNIDIHCIIDERLEIKYRYLQAYYRKNERLEHILDSNISSSKSKENILSEFERIYSNKSKKHCEDRLLMQNILTEASTNRYHILLRWVIAHMKENDMTVDDMKGTLDIAIEKNDKDIAKAIAWYITREFFVKFANQLKDATDIFPGIRCSCRGSLVLDCSFCTNERVIIILTRTAIKEKPDIYHGFTIEEVNPDLSNSVDSEAVTISNLLSSEYTNSYFLKVNLPQKSVENIFNRHSNVTLICSSVLMSKSFDKVHAVQERICIHLYCKKKGIIPLGEDHFPTSIHGIPTDIIEGNISFITKLRIGETIGPQTSIGTLGGFVKYMDFDCFLTCAHVMYDLQTLLSSSYDFSRLLGAKAFCHSAQGLIDCGKVIWRTFDHDDKLKTSIDAALVMMQNNATFDQNDFILDRYGNACHFRKLGLSSPFLNDNCLDHEDFCILQQTAKVVGAGSMTKLEENVQFPKQTDVDILFSSTGQTATVVNGNVFQPLWINSQAHMQLSTGFLNDKRIFRMYNQITINLGLQPGDSGTCIYIVQHPYNKNGCIGMAIAFCGGMTIVTPLKDILKRISSS